MLVQLQPSSDQAHAFLLEKIFEQTQAMANGDYSKRTVIAFQDLYLSGIAANLNTICDMLQMNAAASANNNMEHTVGTFIEVISSYTNLDFKRKLPISENGTVMDAIATGINMLGDELEMSVISRSEVETERNRLDEAQALARVGSWQLDIKSGKFSLSREMYRIFGLDLQKTYSLRRAYRHFRKLIHAQSGFQPLRNALQESDRYSAEGTISTGDREKHIFCMLEVLRNDLHEIVSLKGTMQDITETKLVEEQLRQAKIEAEELNHSKSRFLANMSHEVRTPLNAILGLADIMIKDNVIQEHRQYLELIKYAGKNLTQLINDVLDLSKIESGNLRLESVPFNLRDTITNNLLSYQFLAQQKGSVLSFKLDESLPGRVKGDPTRVSQVLINLLSNAIKFTDEGSIHVSVGATKETGNNWRIEGSVTDNGIGIPPEKISSIFQSFTQADESITRRYGGSGLGLSICKNLLEQMSGSIRVVSPVDNVLQRGTCFTFTFLVEVLYDEDGPVLQPKPEMLSFPRPVKILLVDDNRINLMVAKKALENLGAVVVTATNGRESIDLAEHDRFDVILMDIQMPEMDGYEATQYLRRNSYEGPIVALSANAFVEDVEKSLAMGMNAHIRKPFSSKELLEVINEFL